jgi:hypothetical protein
MNIYKPSDLYKLGMLTSASLENWIEVPASPTKIIGIIGLVTHPKNPFVEWVKYNKPEFFGYIEKEYEALLAVAKELDRLEKPILEFGRVSKYHPLDNTTKKLVEERFAVQINMYIPSLRKLAETIRNIADLIKSGGKTGKTELAKGSWVGNFFWKLYEKTLKVIVDVVLERWWPKNP